MKIYGSFSQAIEAGIPLSKQAFKIVARYAYRTSEIVETCAIGAGLHSIFQEEVQSEKCLPGWFEIEKYYRYMVDERYQCPHRNWFQRDCSFEGALFSLCMHLNDVHLWKREKIAKWLKEKEEEIGFVTLEESDKKIQLEHGEEKVLRAMPMKTA